MISFNNNIIGTGREQRTTSYLLVHLAREHYALPSNFVREISRWRVPIPVPGAPPIIPGIIHQRGVVLPVVRLCQLLGLPETAPGRATRYLIAQYDDVDMALQVDAVIDLVELADTAYEPVPATLNPHQARALQAITRLNDMPVALLDLGEIVKLARGEG